MRSSASSGRGSVAAAGAPFGALSLAVGPSIPLIGGGGGGGSGGGGSVDRLARGRSGSVAALNRALLTQSYPVLIAGGVGLVLAGLALDAVQVPGQRNWTRRPRCTRANRPPGHSARLGR